MTVAIKVENLSKKYVISHQRQEPYASLTDVLANSARNLRRRWLPPFEGRGEPAPTEEEFWALKDVSFEVRQGERLGVIGRNGAGKSTLLKVLSRITEPTSGRISVTGRVASLLEVGTGFHPELTGRENIFLNGSIMGMSKQEIRRKFDEIVAFSEVERFLDTPVKRYSSGMYVRLGFAVAAHLDPEILVVDEVLAVGDIQFQKKCLGKMELVGKEGRTVIFVSHNLAAVETLCPRAVLIDKGRTCAVGRTKEVVAEYVERAADGIHAPVKGRTDRSGKGNIKVVDTRFVGARSGDQYAIGDDVCIQLDVMSNFPHEVKVRLSLSVYNAHDAPLISCDSLLAGQVYAIPGACMSTITCRIVAPQLNTGDYYVSFAIYNADDEAEDWISPLGRFSITSGVFDGRLASNHFPLLSKFDWDVRPVVADDRRRA